MDPLESFRAETRQWLEDNAPESLRGTATSPFAGHWGGRDAEFETADHQLWFERALERGWTAPAWPTEYGGGGLSTDQHRVLLEELQRIGMPQPLVGFGLTMIGPVLLLCANEEQKREHIPRIIRGEIRWCQGYSEPGAGSDLASLRTKAVRDGDDFVVSGQKVWTSHAEKSDWIFCLVRTNPDAPKKQQGITFLIFDMQSPGITTRPIELISGASPFCEVFFHEVRVPVSQVIGEIDRGWGVAKALLGFERAMVGEALAGGGTRPEILRGFDLRDHALEYVGLDGDRLADPHFRDALADFEMDKECMRLTMQRGRDAQSMGKRPGAETSISKIVGTELNQRRWKLAVAMAGEQGLGWEGDAYSGREAAVTRTWLRSRANTIEGGTTEVQLNIVAKRILGMPQGNK